MAPSRPKTRRQNNSWQVVVSRKTRQQLKKSDKSGVGDAAAVASYTPPDPLPEDPGHEFIWDFVDRDDDDKMRNAVTYDTDLDGQIMIDFNGDKSRGIYLKLESYLRSVQPFQDAYGLWREPDWPPRTLLSRQLIRPDSIMVYRAKMADPAKPLPRTNRAMNGPFYLFPHITGDWPEGTTWAHFRDALSPYLAWESTLDYLRAIQRPPIAAPAAAAPAPLPPLLPPLTGYNPNEVVAYSGTVRAGPSTNTPGRRGQINALPETNRNGDVIYRIAWDDGTASTLKAKDIEFPVAATNTLKEKILDARAAAAEEAVGKRYAEAAEAYPRPTGFSWTNPDYLNQLYRHKRYVELPVRMNLLQQKHKNIRALYPRNTRPSITRRLNTLEREYAKNRQSLGRLKASGVLGLESAR